MTDRKRPDITHGEGGNQGRRVRRCVTMDKHWSLVRKDPEYRWRRRQIEAEIQDWVRRYGGKGLRTGLIRIPVVVHVIHHTASENISDAQIHSQIDVLNADYRRLNADAAATPAVFAGVAADARLEFALAVRDPNCNPTTGITRTSTSVVEWTYPGEGMKAASSGGHDPWDVTKYLNVWVVNYGGGVLGYGTFPGMPANIQGVVCHYQAFGNTGTLEPTFNLGRTMTHEVGHWLNLNHIWGDDGGACSGSDNVADTPNQADLHFGCPGFPSVSCSNGPNGDMFMNYMDYTDDACMNMFTAGQSERMDAALHTTRASILASDGLVTPTGVPGPDLWSQDVSDDFGVEPDPTTQPMWISDDIWVRTSNDGLMNQDHQNPEYRPPGSPSNYVYVRVRNRACGGTASGTLKLYWAKASSGLAWPSPWDGSVTSPLLMGQPIGSQSVAVAGGTDEILTFPWMPPNPADYAVFGADQGHFCLLARIETAATAPFGMTFAETSNLYANVQNNNNIVWKNCTVVDEVPGSGRISTVLMTNYGKEIEWATLVFQIPKRERPSIFDWGEVLVELPANLLKRRKNEDDVNVRQLNETTFQLLGTGARLGLFELAPGDIHGVRVRLLPKHQKPLGVRNFTLDLLQKAGDRIVGGQRLILKGLPDPRYVAVDNASLVFDGVSWVPAVGGHCGCSCK